VGRLGLLAPLAQLPADVADHQAHIGHQRRHDHLPAGFLFPAIATLYESPIAPSVQCDAPPPLVLVNSCARLRLGCGPRACCCKTSSAWMLRVRGPSPPAHSLSARGRRRRWLPQTQIVRPCFLPPSDSRGWSAPSGSALPSA
jgi:hypothetical protein